MRWLSIPFAFLLLAHNGFAQDLDQLRTRAEDHWKKRAAGDRQGAAQYVERSDRERFLSLYEPQVLKATIESLRFTDDRKEVFVVVKTRMKLTIGEFDKTVSEKWIWSNNWFLYVGSLATIPFLDNPAVTTGPVSPTFDLLDSELNLERHVQGEQIPVSVRFKAKRSDVANIVVRGTGTTIKGVQWDGPDGGKIDAVIDTSLMTTNISQPLTFEVVGHSGEHFSKTVKVSGQIEGRIRIKQTPEFVDAAAASKVELDVANISSAPVRLIGLASHNPAFTLTEGDTPAEIKPGESLKLQFSHEPQRTHSSAAVILEFADRLFPQPLVFPLSIRMAEEKFEIDPARIEEFSRQQGIHPGTLK